MGLDVAQADRHVGRKTSRQTGRHGPACATFKTDYIASSEVAKYRRWFYRQMFNTYISDSSSSWYNYLSNNVTWKLGPSAGSLMFALSCPNVGELTSMTSSCLMPPPGSLLVKMSSPVTSIVTGLSTWAMAIRSSMNSRGSSALETKPTWQPLDRKIISKWKGTLLTRFKI